METRSLLARALDYFRDRKFTVVTDANGNHILSCGDFTYTLGLWMSIEECFVDAWILHQAHVCAEHIIMERKNG